MYTNDMSFRFSYVNLGTCHPDIIGISLLGLALRSLILPLQPANRKSCFIYQSYTWRFSPCAKRRTML